MISQSPSPHHVTPETPQEARRWLSCHRRHMNTLQLQMEVTRFLHRCESAGTSQTTTLPLPTLFGNNHMKMDVACKVRTMFQAPSRLSPLSVYHSCDHLILFLLFDGCHPARVRATVLESKSTLITPVWLVPGS